MKNNLFSKIIIFTLTIYLVFSIVFSYNYFNYLKKLKEENDKLKQEIELRKEEKEFFENEIQMREDEITYWGMKYDSVQTIMNKLKDPIIKVKN